MRIRPTADHQGFLFRGILWLLGLSLLCAPSTVLCAAAQPGQERQPASDDSVGQVVRLIQAGRWDEAAAALAASEDASDPRQQALRSILDEHQALAQQRTEKQAAVYAERYETLCGTLDRVSQNDPNLNYQRVFRQVQNVWKDASQQQKETLSEQPAFAALMDRARRNAETCYAEGLWSKAYSTGIWWLLIFKPDDAASRAWDEKISEVNAILGFLRDSPCEDKQQAYTAVQRSAVHQVLSILQARYVKPPDFHKMMAGMLNRSEILGDVLKADPGELVLTVDPNSVPVWAGHIRDQSEAFGQVEPGDINRQDFEELLDALTALNEQTLKLPEGFLLAMMTDAALGELDPFTVVVWPFAVRDFDKALTGQFGGIGIHLRKEGEGLRVLSLIPDSPAMEAGLQAEALIVAVDGESTRDMSATCAVRKISGPIGTSVTLTIRYPGSETEDLVTLVRDRIVIPAVEGSRQAEVDAPAPTAQPETVIAETPKDHWDYFLDAEHRIGYLRLKNFTEQTIPEVHTALAHMENRGLAGLILDLRGNGGGLLSAAVEVADLFIENGFLLQSKGREGAFAVWAAREEDGKREYPLAVLIDGASASASEIVAGILGSPVTRRAVLIGDRSYGKGSVQEVVTLGTDKGKLKFTTAHYYLPDGSPVKSRQSADAYGTDDWGIAPDIHVPLYDFELRQIRQVNAKRTTVTNAEPNEDEPSELSIQEEMLAADPQLATALLVIKAQIVNSQNQ